MEKKLKNNCSEPMLYWEGGPLIKIKDITTENFQKLVKDLHKKMPVCISIPRPNPENKNEILKKVEMMLEDMIEEQSREENKI